MNIQNVHQNDRHTISDVVPTFLAMAISDLDSEHLKINSCCGTTSQVLKKHEILLTYLTEPYILSIKPILSSSFEDFSNWQATIGCSDIPGFQNPKSVLPGKFVTFQSNQSSDDWLKLKKSLDQS